MHSYKCMGLRLPSGTVGGVSVPAARKKETIMTAAILERMGMGCLSILGLRRLLCVLLVFQSNVFEKCGICEERTTFQKRHLVHLYGSGK